MRKILSPQSESLFQNIEEDCIKHGLEKITESELIVSPASILELIGIVPPEIQISVPNDIYGPALALVGGSEEMEFGSVMDSVRQRIYWAYKIEISKHSQLSKEFLLEKYHQQMKHTNPKMRNWFEEVVLSKIEKEEMLDFMYDRLAVDRMYNHEFPKELAITMESLTLIDVVRAVEFNHNISQVRGLQQLWKKFQVLSARNASSIANGITPEDVRRNIQKATRAFSFKKTQDLLDLELIHYATIGKTINSRTEKVICFTQDPFHQTKIRLELMISFIKNAYEIFKEARKPIDPFLASHGMAIFVDSNGFFQDQIKVANLKGLFDRMQSEIIENI